LFSEVVFRNESTASRRRLGRRDPHQWRRPRLLGRQRLVKDLLFGESASTAGYWHSLALVRAAASDGLPAARALHARRAAGVEARASVLEVEAVKARHRGRPEGAGRIAALAAELTAAPA